MQVGQALTQPNIQRPPRLTRQEGKGEKPPLEISGHHDSVSTARPDSVRFGGYYGKDTVLLNGSLQRQEHPDLVALDEIRQKLESGARKKGLDFFPVQFYLLDREKHLQAAARNGFMERYPHWSWGQEYFQLGLAMKHGVKKKQEMVQNGNPAQSFLLELDPPYVQKALMAMGYARSDLYKNNMYFQQTDRRMIDDISGNATAIRAHINNPKLGLDTVETFIDKVHSIRNLIDASQPPRAVGGEAEKPSWNRPERDVLAFLLENAKDIEPWQRDILTRLRAESYHLVPNRKTQLLADGWAAFWNQKLNKENLDLLDLENAVNESRWTAELLKLNPVEVNTYKLGLVIFRQLEERFRQEAREELKAEGVEIPEPLLSEAHLDQLERLGDFFKEALKPPQKEEDSADSPKDGLLEKLERFPMSAEQHEILEKRVMDKLLRVRRFENDVTLIRKHFTQEMAEEAFLYTYRPDARTPRRRSPYSGASKSPPDPQKPGTKLVLDTREYEAVRDNLVKQYENVGNPIIEVVSSDYGGEGELFLQHIHEYDLKKDYAEKTMTNLAGLWGKPVHMLTKLTDEKGKQSVVRLTSNGDKTVVNKSTPSDLKKWIENAQGSPADLKRWLEVNK